MCNEAERKAGRLAIAKDVLETLSQTSYTKSHYFRFRNSIFFEKAFDKNAKSILPEIRQNCEVCALGGMMLSYTNIFNEVTTAEMNSDFKSKLREFFDDDQLLEIESAFEGWNTYYEGWGRHTVVQHIMENLIENDGTFIPTERLNYCYDCYSYRCGCYDDGCEYDDEDDNHYCGNCGDLDCYGECADDDGF